MRARTRRPEVERAIVILVGIAVSGCRLLDAPVAAEQAPSDAGRERERERGRETSTADASPPAFPRRACVHQQRDDLGAPVHRERGGRGGFVRLAECTPLTLIEGNERWLRASFPLTEGRTEGWISRRYVMEGCEQLCPGLAAPASPPGEPDGWPPQPRGMCERAGATGRERLLAGEAPDRAAAGGGAKGQAGARVVVASWNLWELYDGVGGDRYLSDEHGPEPPAAQYERRLALFAKTLRRVEADVLLLQEVEGAEVACALAAAAWPGSGWSCASGRGAERNTASPQNVAIATRLAGDLRHLRPDDARATGSRGAVELSLEGAGGLTVTTVHLKSSIGQYGPDDCANARQRMGAAAALAARYDGWSSVLLAGDFNVDPLDTGRAVYDRTPDILAGRGFERLCAAAGCALPTYPAGGPRGRGSAIDLAFFRGGGRWRAERLGVIAGASRGNRLASDHLPIEIELRL